MTTNPPDTPTSESRGGGLPVPDPEAVEHRVHAALETYSNVHRGSGHASLTTTRLYEQAREIVLDRLGLDRAAHTVMFCSPRRATLLEAELGPAAGRVSSREEGLAMGLRALAYRRGALPGGPPLQPGGGTARLVSPRWVLWANAPDRFEAGTPAIVNVIGLAAALREDGRRGPGGPAGSRGVSPSPPAGAAATLPDGLAGRPLLEALRKTLIGRNGTVPTADGPRPFINLDNAASTPTFEPVWRAALAGWRMPPAAATTLAGEAEAIVARMLGAPPEAYDVFFTANTTEAINLASESLGREVRQGTEPVIVDTLLEHNSNELPWRMVPAASLVRTPIDGEGFFDLDALEATLRAHNVEGRHGKKRVVLVAVSGASNVLGTFNDLSAVAEIAHRYGARLLVDGAQLVAHRRVALEAWGVDYLALSAHKVYAPFGSGALVVRRGLLAFGPDEMAEIRASGVENTGGIAALSAALSLLERIGLDVVRKEEQALTAQALRGMARIPNLRIYGVADPDSPNFAAKGGVIAFDLRGVLPGRVAAALAWQGGIGVRYGCHCAHLLIKRLVGVNPPLEQLQGLLLRMNHSLALPGVVRVSFGIENTEADVAALLRALGDLARRPPARKDGAMRDALEQFAQGAAERVYG